jgi:hypothetical protein
MEVDSQGLPGRYTPQGRHPYYVDRWKALFDYPNPAYSCMMVCGGIPMDLSNFVGKVYNLCRM